MSNSLESFRLVVFRTVAEKLSFTQAAEVLRLTQPAVTSHIKALEDDLSVRLFERTGGRIAITPAGEVLVRYAREIGRLSEDVLLHIGAMSGEQRGKLGVFLVDQVPLCPHVCRVTRHTGDPT